MACSKKRRGFDQVTLKDLQLQEPPISLESDQFSPDIVQTLGKSSFCEAGFSRDVPFGCTDEGLLSVLYFLPGQAMRPHRHLDSDEYFTALLGDADMIINVVRTPLPQGHTYLRPRGTQHAIRNSTDYPLVIQSFQSPIPREAGIVWERAEADWTCVGAGYCRRCWCGQSESGHCADCGAPYRI